MADAGKTTDLPVISLFSGAMGLDLGLERAGFRVAVALECNPFAVATIRANRPELPLIDRPIEQVTTDEILEVAGLRPSDPVVVAGGPSCQVFSTAGSRGSLGDPRGELFEHFVRVVRESQPRFFVMENVRGLLSAAARHRPLNKRGPGHPPLEPDEELGSAFQVVAEHLRGLGYYTVFDVLNSADFGTPQTRQRLLLLGSRDGEALRMPTPTHARDGEGGRTPWRTLRDAAGDLTEAEPEFYTFCPAKEKFLKQVPEGGNWRDLPEEVRKEALGRAFDSWGGRSGFFRRLAWDRPSPALTTRPDSKATSLCHPTELRPLSVREYARVQEFPDHWTFAGPVRKKYEQVGNAVPLSLGEAAGRALRSVMAMPSVAGRLGHVECFNLDLLTKLMKRPKTIVNPPRMRNDTETATIGNWYEGPGRMRRDALDYAAPEVAAELRARVRLRADAAPADLFEETTSGDGESAGGDWAAEGEVRLAAAE
ncbi:DNA cytosine methyltransferase [uncultured Sphingomonas sp.]|uniref:DNA cytosine methyltransferase n=1 Tax=uncultured Sphingomonas sp. TaxID=158754 RepID=UPI0025EDA387|nr:DNA cytosine methyltransferase [uncultured Sphingomonas sp.]